MQFSLCLTCVCTNKRSRDRITNSKSLLSTPSRCHTFRTIVTTMEEPRFLTYSCCSRTVPGKHVLLRCLLNEAMTNSCPGIDSYTRPGKSRFTGVSMEKDMRIMVIIIECSFLNSVLHILNCKPTFAQPRISEMLKKKKKG